MIKTNIAEEKAEMFNVCNLDLKDEIFKLRLVVAYLKLFSNVIDSTGIEDFLLAVIDKLEDVHTGYIHAYSYFQRKEDTV